MSHLYRVLCIWMVVALVVMGIAPVAAAEEPQEAVALQHVPPRPDLLAQLRKASTGRPGFTLDAALSEAEAKEALSRYLALKLDPKVASPGLDKAAPTGAKLNAPPINNRLLVALVDYGDLAHNNIPKPSTENNTDYWVQDFNLAHYNTLLFSDTNPWSLRRYFREASDWGASPTGYDLVGDIHDWSTLPGTAAWYGDDDPTGGVDNNLPGDLARLISDTVSTLAGWTPAGGWAAYDNNGDNIIDYFVIVHAGKGQEAGGGALGDDAIWSTRGTLATPVLIPDTAYYVQSFVVVAEDSPLGVWVHELGHLFGLPDTWNVRSGGDVYYDMDWPQQDLGGVGEASPAFWDPMAQGCWLGRPLGTRPASMPAWARIRLGWLSPAVWDLSMMPASIYLAQVETPSASNKALKIELPTRIYVTPHSGNWMRQAPDPGDMTSPSFLTHTLQITATGSLQFRFWQNYDLETNFDFGYFEVYDGSTWTRVITVTGSSGGWVQQTVNLTPYIGTLQEIRFNLVRDATIEGLGWFLDDFELIQDGVVTWRDDVELSAGGPPQGAGAYTWISTRFPRREAYGSEHYYLVEWRNDLAGFDVGLQEAYNMTNLATGKAEYFRYNPGLLIWYVNPIYQDGDNDVLRHPGEGFLLALDSHPDPLLQLWSGAPWRTRVQMLDATFRHSAPTYANTLTDGGGLPNVLGPLAATTYFWDKWSSYPYWDPGAPDNSAKTLQYGVKLEVEGENPDQTGATVRFSIDAADMTRSTKSVDKATAAPGEELTYTIVLRNNGIADAHTIVVSDTAPAHTTYSMGSVTVAGSPSYTVTENRGIRWQGTVLLGQPVTITFKVTLDPVIDNGTLVRNIAYVYEGTVPETVLYADTTIQSAPCLTSSTKSSEPNMALAGDIVTYTIVLNNTGDSNGTVVITDCIPACTTYVPGSLIYSAGSGYYNAQTNCIYWQGPVEAQVGPSVWISFQVQINEGQIPCTLITNRATINDGYHPPFEIGANTSVLTGPNLRTSTKTVDKDVAEPGEQLQYTIYVHNGGNRDANVTLSDLIPDNTSYVTQSLTYTLGSGTFTGSGISWSGSLGVGESATIRFRVEITSPLTSGTIITNTADLLANSVHYYRTVTTTVRSEPWLYDSTKTATSNSGGYGGVLTYTISLVNNGTQDATVNVTDTIPSGTQYISGTLAYSSGSGSYDSGNNRILWSGTITAGERVTITFGVTITLQTTGIITNTAWVYDHFHDPFPLRHVTYVAAVIAESPEEDIYCGDAVDVPIRVENVADLQGWEIVVEYDENILAVEGVQENTGLGVPVAWTIKDYATPGLVRVVATLLSQPTGLWGDYTLYTIRFRAVGPGTSPITITYALLSNTPSPAFTPIPHNELDGSVTVLDRAIVGRAYLQGRPTTATGGAELYHGSQLLGTTAADGSYSFCPPVGTGESFLLRIAKDGYLYAEKLVTVNVTGTITLSDVTLLGGDAIGPQVTVTTPGPPTCPAVVTMTVAGPPDNRVNVLDLTFVGARFFQTNPPDPWGPDICDPSILTYRADINEDNMVNIFDLVLVGNNFGRIAPSPWY